MVQGPGRRDRGLRWRTAAAATALFATLLAPTGATATAAAEPPPPTIDAACPEGRVPTGTFPDVPGATTIARGINCIAAYGVTRGTASGLYDPSGSVTRVQMALFVARLAASNGVQLQPGASGFTDTATLQEEARRAIDGLQAAGIVRGTSATTYSPAAPVTRSQMASFLQRLQQAAAGTGFAGTEDYFTDDDRLPAEIQADINAIASAGVAQGVAPGSYAPGLPLTRQQMASFLARSLDHGVRAGRVASVFYEPLTVVTSAFTPMIAGLPSLTVLHAAGGEGERVWSAEGLPAGLEIDAQGAVTGTPVAPGQGTATVTVTDARGGSAEREIAFDVSDELPETCLERECAQTEQDSRTVVLADGELVDVVRVEGRVAEVLVQGRPLAVDDVLTAPPSALTETGFAARVTSVEDVPEGVRATVEPTSFADAYASGVVKASSDTVLEPDPQQDLAAQDLAALDGAGSSAVRCADLGVDVSGIRVTPNLTPSVAALWERPIFGGGGVYVGTGGLELFQLDLDGSLTVALGLDVQAATTCSVDLPAVRAAVPAGPLGAVVLRMQPSLTLQIGAGVKATTSMTLRCGAFYRWSAGTTSSAQYCHRRDMPFELDAASGVTATLTANLASSITLNEIVGVTGEITGSLTAGYLPTARPQAYLDGKVAFDLRACLACIWRNSPASLSLFSGTFFDRRLVSHDLYTPRSADRATGSLQGQVTDAVTGSPLSGVRVLLDGSRTATTDGDGQYTFTAVPPGDHSLSAQAPTHVPQTSPSVAVLAGQSTTENFALSRAGQDAVTVTLSWDDAPRDLDLHLSGPDGSGGRFHASFHDRYPVGHVELDVDDVDGYGPETMTVSRSGDGFVAGRYAVWVHSYSGYHSGDVPLPGSDAKITVTDRSGRVRTYVVPVTGPQDASIWRVADFSVDAAGGLVEQGLYQEFDDGDESLEY